MSWRTVVIANSAKLDYRMNYLVIRQEKVSRIHLSEIGLLLIESTAVSLTTSLLAELTKHKIKVVFCDEKRNPSSELIGYYGSHDCSLKIRKQMEWTEFVKKSVWTEIVSEKIRNQRDFLQDLGKEEECMLLTSYLDEIQLGDSTNREGHAAKVYFNAVFGKDFSRSAENSINAALNYGYTLILSTFNREIVSSGYLTQIGIFHDNMFNPFNLASDLMEPFRIVVDRQVVRMMPDQFEHDEKMKLLSVLDQEVFICKQINRLTTAIKLYCRSVFNALNEKDISELRFMSLLKRGM